MDLLSSIRKEGSRGGVDFKWSDVTTSQHRENYLGHSLMAPVGRWQKNRDLSWYAKADDSSNPESGETAEEKKVRERREEIRRIKEAEEDALARALGLPVTDRGVTGANAIAVGEIRRVVREAEVEAGEDGGRFGDFVGKVDGEQVTGGGANGQTERGGLLGGKSKEKERRHRRIDDRSRSRSRSREHRGRRHRHRDGDEGRPRRDEADRERRPRSRSFEEKERERRHRSRSDGRYRARSRSLDEREKSRRSRNDERYRPRMDDREGRRGREYVPRRSLSPEGRERNRRRSRSAEQWEQKRRRSRSRERREQERRRSRSPAPRDRERRRERGRENDGGRRWS